MHIVTGAAGFIGYHVSSALERDGNEVILVDYRTDIASKKII